MKEGFTIFMIVLLAVGVLAPSAHADFMLYIDDPGDALTGLTITDNGAGDINPMAGMITFSGAVGTTWIATVTTGVSKPAIGGVTDPWIDLNNVSLSSGAAGTLTIMLTDTNFSPDPTWTGTTLISAIGGTTTGTVWLDQILDYDNMRFASLADAELSVSLGPLTGGVGYLFGDAGTDFGPLVSGPFSLTEIAVITHTQSGLTSFDASSVVVPVPAAVILCLLGSAVLGVRLHKYA